MRKTERLRLYRKVQKLVLGLGGKARAPSEVWYWLTLPTPFGEIAFKFDTAFDTATNKGGWPNPAVYGRFWDVSKVRPFVDARPDHWFSRSVNKYSGKWNHHFVNCPNAIQAFADFERDLKALLALNPEELCQPTAA